MTIERIQGAGPWPDAVRTGDLVFLSARTAVGETANGLPAAGGSRFTEAIEGETGVQIWGTFQQIETSLERAGSSLAQIVLMNGWYADFRDWPIMDRLRSAFFEGPGLPVSTGFGAAGFQDEGARVLYEAIALAGDREREVVGSPLQVGSYLAGCKVGQLIFLAGEVPADIERGVVITKPSDLGDDADEVMTGVFGLDGWEGRMRAQTWSVYKRIEETLAGAGSGLGSIVKQNVYLRDLRDLPAFERMSRQILGDNRPATTFVKVEQYGHQSFDLEVEVTAVEAPGETTKLEAPQGSSDDYPEAVLAAPLALLSGLVAVDADGSPAEAAGQTHRIYDQLEEILQRAGLERDSLVRQVVYVSDLRALPEVEAVALERTADALPATTFVGVGEIVPSDAAVQIDFTAAT